MEGRKCNEVRFIEAWQTQQGMTDLFDIDRSRKGRFLPIVSLEKDTPLLIEDCIRRNRRVMAGP